MWLWREWTKFWINYAAYVCRDPYDVAGNAAWARQVTRRYNELKAKGATE